jgi:hypothetical protein
MKSLSAPLTRTVSVVVHGVLLPAIVFNMLKIEYEATSDWRSTISYREALSRRTRRTSHQVFGRRFSRKML